MLKIAYLICAFTLCSTMLLSQTQLVLQKGMSGVVFKDAFVWSENPTQNYGDNNAILLHADVTGTIPYIRRSYLRWDLSSIPSNAIILSASLELYATTAGGQSTSLDRVESYWIETGITWNNAPNSPLETITTTATMNGSWETFNVTSFVQNWVNYPNNNHGVRVRMASEYGTFSCKGCPPVIRGSSYRSSKYTSGSPNYQFRPKLIVEYVLPIEIELVSTTHCTTTSSTDGSITISASGGDGNYTYQWHNSSSEPIGTDSPTVSGLAYGWYGVQVTDGLDVTSYMSFLVGVECETVSIAYNPGPNYVDDALVSSYHASGSDSRDNNYATNEKWGVRRYYTSVSGYYNWHSFLRFRLLVDQTLKYNSANLLVNVNFSAYNSSNQIYLYRTVSDWQENVVTYNTSPTRSSSITASWGLSATGVKTIDVKDFFGYWKINPNYGFYIDVENPSETGPNRRMEVWSSDYTNSSLWPRMEFEVSLPCGSPIKPSRELNSGFYKTMRNKLFIEHSEANYKSSLSYRIINNENVNISNGNALVNTVKENGKTILIFDFGSGGQCIPDGFYILELEDALGNIRTLRFKHENSSC